VAEDLNRTLVCSVLFIDIVDYSKHDVSLVQEAEFADGVWTAVCEKTKRSGSDPDL
jgi:hypothetical protein